MKKVVTHYGGQDFDRARKEVRRLLQDGFKITASDCQRMSQDGPAKFCYVTVLQKQ